MAMALIVLGAGRLEDFVQSADNQVGYTCVELSLCPILVVGVRGSISISRWALIWSEPRGDQD